MVFCYVLAATHYDYLEWRQNQYHEDVRYVYISSSKQLRGIRLNSVNKLIKLHDWFKNKDRVFCDLVRHLESAMV